jgi:hypothetical protein
VQRASGIPCSLLSGDNETQTSGAFRREKADVYPVFEMNRNSHSVIASVAKQSMPPSKERMDCFAALAMTAGGTPDDAAFSSRAPNAAQQRVLGAGVHSTLHGVVFAIFCFALAAAPL